MSGSFLAWYTIDAARCAGCQKSPARKAVKQGQSKDTGSRNMTGFIEMMTFTITASTFISYAGCLGRPYAVVCVHVRIAALGRKYFALTQCACDIVKD